MPSDFPPTSSFCTVKCAKKELRSCLGPFHSTDNQPAALCEAIMFKYRIQRFLKETASTYLWIAFSLCSRQMLTLLFWLLLGDHSLGYVDLRSKKSMGVLRLSYCKDRLYAFQKLSQAIALKFQSALIFRWQYVMWGELLGLLHPSPFLSRMCVSVCLSHPAPYHSALYSFKALATV